VHLWPLLGYLGILSWKDEEFIEGIVVISLCFFGFIIACVLVFLYTPRFVGMSYFFSDRILGSMLIRIVYGDSDICICD
jgi:hypothetical protein